MKALLYKQLQLCAHPMTFVFALFGIMLIIPSYPYSVAFFYVTLGIFFMFQNSREQRDASFSALLPIRKRDSVKAGFVFSILIELISIVIAACFAIISSKINKTGNPAGTDANVALFGFVFLIFALFNLLFFPSFYRTGYKIGIPFFKACAAMLIIVLCDIVFCRLKPFMWLDGYAFSRQIPFTAACAAIYTALSFLSYHKSAVNYEKADL